MIFVLDSPEVLMRTALQYEHDRPATTIDSRRCEWRYQNSNNSRKNWGLPPSCIYRHKSMVDDLQTPWFLYWLTWGIDEDSPAIWAGYTCNNNRFKVMWVNEFWIFQIFSCHVKIRLLHCTRASVEILLQEPSGKRIFSCHVKIRFLYQNCACVKILLQLQEPSVRQKNQKMWRQ